MRGVQRGAYIATLVQANEGFVCLERSASRWKTQDEWPLHAMSYNKRRGRKNKRDVGLKWRGERGGEGERGMSHFSSGCKVLDPFHDVARYSIGDTFTVWTNDQAHVVGVLPAIVDCVLGWCAFVE